MTASKRWNWRSRRGWFRIWLIATVLWYALAAFQMRQLRADDFSTDLADFNKDIFDTRGEAERYLDRKRRETAAQCIEGSYSTKITTEHLVRDQWYQNQLRAWRKGLTRSQWLEPERQNMPFLKSRIVNGNDLVERPAEYSYDVDIGCITKKTVVPTLVYLAVPFIMPLAFIALIWLSMRGARIFGWVAEGFRADEQLLEEPVEAVDNSSPTMEQTLSGGSNEFSSGMKRVGAANMKNNRLITWPTAGFLLAYSIPRTGQDVTEALAASVAAGIGWAIVALIAAVVVVWGLKKPTEVFIDKPALVIGTPIAGLILAPFSGLFGIIPCFAFLWFLRRAKPSE